MAQGTLEQQGDKMKLKLTIAMLMRAVVEKIDGPTFTIEQIDNYVYNNTFCATPDEYSRVWNDALEDTRNKLKDPKDGIAALVKRDKEMA